MAASLVEAVFLLAFGIIEVVNGLILEAMVRSLSDNAGKFEGRRKENDVLGHY